MNEGDKLAGGFQWVDSGDLSEERHNKRIRSIIIPAMILPFIGALVYFVFAGGGNLTKIAYSATKIFTVVWPMIAVIYILKQKLKWPVLKGAHHWKAVPLGVLVGAGIVGLMFLLMQTSMGMQVESSAANMRDAVLKFGLTQSNYWLFAVFLSVFHSLLEEYYWRWFVFGGLCQMVFPGWAHILAGAAFMSHHIIVLLQYFPAPLTIFLSLMIGVGGVIWSWMYLRQGSLMGAWIAHMIVDFGALWIGYQLIFGATSS